MVDTITTTEDDTACKVICESMLDVYGYSKTTAEKGNPKQDLLDDCAKNIDLAKSSNVSVPPYCQNFCNKLAETMLANEKLSKELEKTTVDEPADSDFCEHYDYKGNK
ncbi:hypothetical protein Aduo_000188 [Ancylostoma duodenale]